MKILVLGSTGYTGSLLLRLLCKHPEVTEITVMSPRLAGQAIDDDYVHTHSEKFTRTKYIDLADIDADYDVVFSALPHGTSSSMYKEIVARSNNIARSDRTSHEGTQNTKTSSTHATTNSLPNIHPLHGSTHKDHLRAGHAHGFVFIDLSADFRFGNFEKFLNIYPDAETTQNTLVSRAAKSAVYGLCELQRTLIEQADIIACPGCYPTSILLPLVPILKYATPRSSIVINSLSGISGAGASPKQESMFCNRAESVKPYKPGKTHRHFFEIQTQIHALAHCEVDFTFSPILVPMKQGILSSIYVPLNTKDVDRAIEALRAQYLDEHFVSVRGADRIQNESDTSEALSAMIDGTVDNTINSDNNAETARTIDGAAPYAIGNTTANTIGNTMVRNAHALPLDIDSRHVRNTNKVHIGIHKEDKALFIFSTIDNLWKGAAGQAIQNFNIRFGFDERTGLDFFSV